MLDNDFSNVNSGYVPVRPAMPKVHVTYENLSQLNTRIFTPEYIRGQKGLRLFAIYPDYWKDSWGPIPLLGLVAEADAYWAKYAAYTGKLLSHNSTFGPRAVLIKRKYKKS